MDPREKLDLDVVATKASADWQATGLGKPLRVVGDQDAGKRVLRPIMEAGCTWRWGVPLDGATLFVKSHSQRAIEGSWGQEGLCWEGWHTTGDESRGVQEG